MKELKAMSEETKKNVLKVQEEIKVQFKNKRIQSRKYEIQNIVDTKRSQFGNITKLKEKYFWAIRVNNDVNKES